MAPLVRNWWMMAMRGAFAVLFGVSILVWPNATLGVVVVLFGVYALVDGTWAVAAALWAAARAFDAWPVALEGVVSQGLGILAIAGSFVSREFVNWVAGWGIVTGVLEVVAAVRLSRDAAGHWLLGAAGVTSLFLAVLVLILPRAEVADVVALIATYAVTFGVLLSLASVRFRLRHATLRDQITAIL